MENSTFYKLGLNIKGLRIFYGLTQEELALAVDITKQAISQYELGISIPERDILLNICRYFRITEDELLNGNYESMKTIIKAPVHDKQYNLEMLDHMLPMSCSDSALENIYFQEAYEIHKKIYWSIVNGEQFEEKLIEKCLYLYDKAFEEGIIEGIANSLWWIMFSGFVTTFCSPQMIEKIQLFQNNRITFKELLKEGFLHSSDMDTSSEEYKNFEKSRMEFLEENEVGIFVKIRLLKNSKEYSDLGDYYLAFIYLFNLIRNTESPEMNSAIGSELMNTYLILGNQYAKKFVTRREQK